MYPRTFVQSPLSGDPRGVIRPVRIPLGAGAKMPFRTRAFRQKVGACSIPTNRTPPAASAIGAERSPATALC